MAARKRKPLATSRRYRRLRAEATAEEIRNAEKRAADSLKVRKMTDAERWIPVRSQARSC